MTAAVEFPGFRVRNPFAFVTRLSSGLLWSVERAYERSKARDRVVDDTRIRTLFILAVFGLGFVGVAAGATHAALFASPRGSAAPLPTGHRMDMVDRNGRMLAADLLHYGLYLDPHAIWDTQETRRALRAALPDLAPERLERALASRGRAFLTSGLTPQQRARIDDMGLPGVEFEPEERRIYPLGRTAAHLIGFANSGGEGVSGAELAFDAPIRAGRDGAMPLSIDLRIQAAMEEELRAVFTEQQALGAVGIVTDVHTGEILALVSFPDFDPNAPVSATPDQRLNRAASSVYEMGSVFKTFSVAMGLDTGLTTMDHVYGTSGLRIGDRSIGDSHHIGRPLTLREIYLHSSNIGTATMALTAPPQALPEYLRRFGLLRAANTELREVARPLVPRRWDPTTVASASFGHALSVSPLAMAQAYGSVLNGGIMVPLTLRPHRPGTPLPQGVRVISESTSRQMLDVMRLNVVAGSGGTGRRADAAGYFVGGKTGSAEKPGRGGYDRTAIISSFAGVFPTEGPLSAPRYYVYVMVDQPTGQGSQGQRTGGFVAAPVVSRVVERIAPFLGVRRAPEAVVRMRDQQALSVLPGHGGAASAAEPTER